MAISAVEHWDMLMHPVGVTNGNTLENFPSHKHCDKHHRYHVNYPHNELRPIPSVSPSCVQYPGSPIFS